MSRLAALVRAWLDTPSRAEVMPKIRETRVVVTALASERVTNIEPFPPRAARIEAMAHADEVCRRYMACQPLDDERPLVPMEPPAPPRPAHPDRALVVAFCLFLAGLLGLFALIALHGCTIRGGACESDDACAPHEVCTRGRCRPPQPQEPPPLPPGAMCVPAPGGPL